MSASTQNLPTAPGATPSEGELLKDRSGNHAEIKFEATTQQYQLVPLQHEPMTLVNAAISYFSCPTFDMLPNQRAGLKRLRQSIAGWERARFTHSEEPTGVPSIQYMTDMIRDIGCVFFFDKLKSVKFMWDGDMPALGSHEAHEGSQDCREDRNYSTITINPGPHSRANFGNHIFGTLLHEACHAFQETYNCRDTCVDPNCVESLRRVKAIGVKGFRGHGSAWYILASHVEAVAKTLFGFDVELGPPRRGGPPSQGLRNDLVELGTVPNDTEIQLCHPSWRPEMLEFCCMVEQEGLERCRWNTRRDDNLRRATAREKQFEGCLRCRTRATNE